MSVVKVSKVIDGREYSIEAGKYARFASGAVMISSGETMVLVTVVASEKEMKENNRSRSAKLRAAERV